MKSYWLKALMAAAGTAAIVSCGGGGGSRSSPVPTTPIIPVVPDPPVNTIFDVNLARQTGHAWVLAWSDEFNGTALDTTRWSHEVNCAGGGNNELQCYQAAGGNTAVIDGQLQIIARAEKVTGDLGWEGNSGNLVQRDYSSARLNSKLKGDWRYGRVEVRAKLPKGKGVWPAIWMMPTDSVYGNWPLSGEIDIMEAVNLGVPGTTSNRVHGTLHYGNSPPNNRSSQVFKDPEFDLTSDFHTYAIEWQKGEIRWYVDNIYYGAIDENAWFTQGTAASDTTSAAPFDRRFHVILNVAVGGNWPGSPDSNTEFPQALAIDFVRVYRCNASNSEGWGCATLEGKEPIYETP